MKSLSLSDEDILKVSNREDVVRETAEQIIKDFSQFGLEFSFTHHSGSFYDLLFQQMAAHVTRLLDFDRDAFFNLLYRIDVSSSEVEEVFAGTPPLEWSDNMALVIIKRELKKVLTRRYFSSRQNP